MSTALKVGNGWIYLTKSEKSCINQILKILKAARTRDHQLCMQDFNQKIKMSEVAVSHSLWILVSARILRIEQRSRSRLFRLVPNWEKKIKEKVRSYNREERSY